MDHKKEKSIRLIKKEISPGNFVEIQVRDEDGLTTVNPNDIDKLLNKSNVEENDLSPMEVILLLLGVDPDVPIKETLFMKEAFLLEKEAAKKIGLNVKSMNFFPHYFGPFSRDLEENIEHFKDDLISVDRSNNKKLIRLTEKGREVAEELISKIPTEKIDKLKYNRVGWDQYGNRGILLRVYRDYPVYASKSKIKDELLGGIEIKEIIKNTNIPYGGEVLKGRVVNVHVKGNKSFETPTKAPTSTEINGKRNISFDGPFMNPVFEITQRFQTSESVTSLHKKNGTFARRVSEINAFADGLTDRYLVKYFPQIPYGKLTDEKLTDKDIRLLVELQIDSNINVITIPEIAPNCSPEDFHRNFLRYWEYISTQRPDASIMPYLSLNQDPSLFERKLEILGEYEKAFQCIGIRFASMMVYRPNLISLAEFSEKEFWVHCSNGKRVNDWKRPSPGGQLHGLQRYGVDTVSIEIPMGGGGSNKDYTTARYFNRDTITIPPITDSINTDGNLVCDCPICEGQNLSELASNLERYVTKDKPLRSVVGDFSKVHEVFASTSEFDISRQKIKEDSLKEYLDGKAGLKDFSGKEYLQGKLNF
ncbi:hypothetical protein [Methanobacterium ferruginis]|uniref:hypothetical protein n=1 Tax=Methanobacterium ferruginis TaxID=710191 RepID=UPI002573E19A|nr:hypothetical protein [Methanobacterium ferruginis]